MKLEKSWISERKGDSMLLTTYLKSIRTFNRIVSERNIRYSTLIWEYFSIRKNFKNLNPLTETINLVHNYDGYLNGNSK